MGHTQHWRRDNHGPVAPVTLRTDKTVAVVVENHQAGDRLGDVVSLFEHDPRIQVVYVLAQNSRFSPSAASYLERFDGLLLTWEQALRYDFDLALAGNNGHNSHLEQLRAPVLVTPHGMGFSSVVPPGAGFGPPLRKPPIVDAIYSTLVRYGRVSAAAITVPHVNHRHTIGRVVAEALEVTHVVGDPAYDRATSSAPERDRFRRAAGVDADERLVVLSTTWGAESLIGMETGLVDRVITELPDDHVVALLVHPGVWSAHSPRQLLAWLADARRRGLRVLEPNSSWLGLLMAADVVIGDHGSTTYMAAALGNPVLLTGGGLGEVAPGSQSEVLLRMERRHDPERSLPAQLETVIGRHDPGVTDLHRSLLTSEPGRSAALVRELIYRLLDLPEPGDTAVPAPLRPPTFFHYGTECR